MYGEYSGWGGACGVDRNFSAWLPKYLYGSSKFRESFVFCCPDEAVTPVPALRLPSSPPFAMKNRTAWSLKWEEENEWQIRFGKSHPHCTDSARNSYWLRFQSELFENLGSIPGDSQ